jgi:hypothetical protein
LIPELRHFKAELEQARALKAKHPTLVETENTWTFDKEWTPSPKAWSDIWLRAIVDLNVRLTPAKACIIDYKSGKRYGNEVKHHEQVLLYTLCAVLRDPTLEQVATELWYTDQDILISKTFERGQILKMFPKFNSLGRRITSSTDYPAKPSQHACRFCPVRTGATRWVIGTGDCALNPADKTELPSSTWIELRNEAILKQRELDALRASAKKF